ncbi:hypothetical protein [Bacillus xiapuensis]|uniref:hypothetical protein n=1 Tax=Bacillus xiapuensis TaxID=2014075 RepID=UPI0012FD6E90|nr:hypothetical protein [Bacillus xiapuensis]
MNPSEQPFSFITAYHFPERGRQRKFFSFIPAVEKEEQWLPLHILAEAPLSA